MASLVVDAIRCVTETDEHGSDDVYIITFRRNTTAPFNSNVGVHGPGTLWTDFDSGNVELTDVTIATFRPDAVYVVMLVERDNDRDISGDEVLGARPLRAGTRRDAGGRSAHRGTPCWTAG